MAKNDKKIFKTLQSYDVVAKFEIEGVGMNTIIYFSTVKTPPLGLVP